MSTAATGAHTPPTVRQRQLRRQVPRATRRGIKRAWRAWRATRGPQPCQCMDGQCTTWPHYANMVLGLWLITGVFALDNRSTGLKISDVVSGVLVIGLSLLSLSRRPLFRLWAPWVTSLIGVWLLFALLALWAPTAAGYGFALLIRALVVAFAVLAPGMPMAEGMYMGHGPDISPGWSYDPLSWPQRAPTIAPALVGCLPSRRMAAFELPHIGALPDPIFGLGTPRVLTSDVSRAFPIADADFGALACLIAFLVGFMRDKARWPTIPSMVTLFGILVMPLGAVSFTLIVMQPLAVGAWCTDCLLAAAAMVIMIALTLDEVVAMGRFLVQAHREGQPLRRVFWLNGTLRDLPVASPVHAEVVRPIPKVWGVALPWHLLASVGLGGWLMFAPDTLASTGVAAHTDHLVGALIITFAVMALAVVGRALRSVNVLFGAWIMAAPWLLTGAPTGSRWSAASVGALVILCSLPRGPFGVRYRSWVRFIR